MVIAPPRRASIGGVTFVELLAVLVILLILAGLVIPGLQGMLGSSNLKGSSGTLLAQLDLARQTASTRNLPVDVRLYQDTTKPLDSNGNSPYRILATVVPASANASGNDEFLAAPQGLPGDVIIDSNPLYSSLLNTGLGAVGLRPVAATELASAPMSVRNLPYIQFVFLPSGTANLDISQKWCLTLINKNTALKNATSTPGSNFVTLVLNPQTSHAWMYQP